MRAALAALILIGCEGRLALRPVELELDGVSGQAETLVVGVESATAVPTCAELTPDRALALDVARRATWTRGQDEERTLFLDPVDDMTVRVWAVSRDAALRPLQIGCDTLAFEDVERPERRLVLRMQP